MTIRRSCRASGLRPSMCGKGNCYNNASVETFFKSLNAELIWRQSWPARRQAEAAICQSINGFYNTAAAIHIWAGSACSRSKPRWHNAIGNRHETGTSPKRLRRSVDRLNIMAAPEICMRGSGRASLQN